MVVAVLIVILIVAMILIRRIIISRRLGKTAWLSIAGLIIILLISAPLLIVPYSRYANYWSKCGHQPILGQNFGGNYFVPGTKSYGVSFFTTSFYCSEDEARAHSLQRHIN